MWSSVRQVLVNGGDKALKRIIAHVVEETDSILLETEIMSGHVHQFHPPTHHQQA
ncbi:MAG TPA: hypothetical protein VGJ20_01795 [Xanthobacteraceae bacterium]|jgi:REP element-mobilizing transposase RayT